jgi:hypothetical protein
MYISINVLGVMMANIVASASKVKIEYKDKGARPAMNIMVADYLDVTKSTLLQDGNNIFSKHNILQWYY